MSRDETIQKGLVTLFPFTHTIVLSMTKKFVLFQDSIRVMFIFGREWRKHPVLYDDEFRHAQQRENNLGCAKKVREAKQAMADAMQISGTCPLVK